MADDQRLDKIEKEFAEFRKDFKDISSTLKSLAGDTADDAVSYARRQAKRALSRGEDLYDDVRGQLNVATDRAENRIRDNPLSTVAIVAAVGFVLGFLTRR